MVSCNHETNTDFLLIGIIPATDNLNPIDSSCYSHSNRGTELKYILLTFVASPFLIFIVLLSCILSGFLERSRREGRKGR